MNWKEIEESFDISSEWMKHITDRLALNAAIEYRRRDNIRNYYDDPYNYNYDRYTPVCKHLMYKTIKNFKLKL